MNFVKRFVGHLSTVHKHRAVVRKLCFKCGLYWQGLTHDLSKYSPVEFWNGVKFYTGVKSPHHGEREVYGYSKAWMHHKGHNKHHAEYWIDKGPVQMEARYLAEMVCDRIAACMVYEGDRYSDDSPLNYYESHYDENQFHEETRRLLEVWLKLVCSSGLDEALTFIKYEIKNREEIT